MSSIYDPNTNRPTVETTDDRSLGELFSDLASETSTLISKEVQLAKTEMSQTAASAGKDIGSLVAGGALAYAGLLVILAGVVLLLGQAINNFWLSALIVGLLTLAIGGFLAKKGLDELKKLNPAPTQTIASLKETKDSIQEQIR